MLMFIIMFIVAVILLYLGANYLVDGSASFAKSKGISTLLVGLTIVAVGTSVPELFVGIVSQVDGVPALSLGNLLGASIVCLTFILGLAAVISPIKIHISTLQNEIPLLIMGLILFFLVGMDGTIDRIDAIILIVFLLMYFYTAYHVNMKKRDEKVIEAEFKDLMEVKVKRERTYVFFIVTGLIALAVGAKLVVESMTRLGEAVGIPAIIIGVSIVALGTSLPELVTTIVSAIKHEEDLELGTLIGSAIFNMLGIVAVLALISPLIIPATFLFIDLAFLFVVSLLLYPLMRRNFVIGRGEGVILLLIYAIYIGRLFF